MSTYKDKLLNLTTDYLISEAKADKGLTPLQKKLARGGRFHRPYKETGMSRKVSHILNKRYTKKDQAAFEKEREAVGQKPKGKYEKGRFKYTSLKGITHAEKDKLAAMKKARAERLKAEMPDSKPPYKNESSIQEVVNPTVKAQRKAISKRVKGSGMVPKYSRTSPETVDQGGKDDYPHIGLHSTYQGGSTKHITYTGKSGTNEKPPRSRRGDYDTRYIGDYRFGKKPRGEGGTPERREGGIKIGDYLTNRYKPKPRKYIKGTHPAGDAKYIYKDLSKRK
jgi:hypothetical protein